MDGLQRTAKVNTRWRKYKYLVGQQSLKIFLKEVIINGF